MKLTTVSGKKANFKVTKEIEAEFQRYMTYQFKKRITEGKSEIEAAQMSQLSVCYLVGEINDFGCADALSYLIEENNYIGA